MAVHARQQFLLHNPTLCSSNNNNNNNHDHDDGSSSVLAWVDSRGRPLQQLAAAPACSSPLANQQVGTVACSRRPAPSRAMPEEFPCSLASLIDEEKGDIDQFLCLQSERLRAALQQQMRRHVLSLMGTLESKASALLRHKDEELARASRTAAELEECLRRSEEESQAWQRMAKENEAMALALSNAIEQARDSAGLASASPPNPATSSCNSSSDPPAAGHVRGQGGSAAGKCRGCGVRDARVLFVPCMHLCACDLCEALLLLCPICSCIKQASMEVLIS